MDLNVICVIGRCSAYQDSETKVPHHQGTRYGSKGWRFKRLEAGRAWPHVHPLHVWIQCGLTATRHGFDIVCTEAMVNAFGQHLNVFPSHLRLLPSHMKQILLFSPNYRLSNEARPGPACAYYITNILAAVEPLPPGSASSPIECRRPY